MKTSFREWSEDRRELTENVLYLTTVIQDYAMAWTAAQKIWEDLNKILPELKQIIQSGEVNYDTWKKVREIRNVNQQLVGALRKIESSIQNTHDSKRIATRDAQTANTDSVNTKPSMSRFESVNEGIMSSIAGPVVRNLPTLIKMLGRAMGPITITAAMALSQLPSQSASGAEVQRPKVKFVQESNLGRIYYVWGEGHTTEECAADATANLKTQLLGEKRIGENDTVEWSVSSGKAQKIGIDKVIRRDLLRVPYKVVIKKVIKDGALSQPTESPMP